MDKFVLAASLALAGASVHAAEPIGKLSNVEGLVSISGKSFVANAKSGSPVSAGSSIMVSTGGKATLLLNDGCVVPLRGGQFVALDPKLTCSQLVNSVAQLAAPYRLAQAQAVPGTVTIGTAAAGGGFVIPGAVMGGIIVSGATIVENSISGN